MSVHHLSYGTTRWRSRLWHVALLFVSENGPPRPAPARALRTLAGLPRNSTDLAIDFRVPRAQITYSGHVTLSVGRVVAVRTLGERLRRATSPVGGVRVRVGRRRCGRVPQGDDVPLAREPPPRSARESSVARRGLARRTHLVDFVRSRSGRVSPRRSTRRRCRMASSDWVTAAWLGRPVGVTRLSATIPDAESEDRGMPSRRSSLRPGTASSEFVLHSGRALPRQDRSGVRRSKHAWVRHHCAISPVS
jgi:hypothetical protein